jgi:AcrR family transcriptional regulator
MKNLKENENRSCTRELEIINAAREVFSEFGYRKTTMDDVSARMNITRSALYYYYRNKDDLFLAIMDNWLADYKEKVEEAISGESTTIEKLEVFCKYYLSYRDRFFRMFKLNDDDCFVNFSLYKRTKAMSIRLQNEIITGILKQDKKLKNSPDLEYYGYLLTHSIRGFVFNSLIEDIDKLKNDVTEMCRIFYCGLHVTIQQI